MHSTQYVSRGPPVLKITTESEFGTGNEFATAVAKALQNNTESEAECSETFGVTFRATFGETPKVTLTLFSQFQVSFISRNTRGGKPSESPSEENCPLEALRGSFLSRNSLRKKNLREVLLEALGFFRGLNWSFPFVVAPPLPLEGSRRATFSPAKSKRGTGGKGRDGKCHKLSPHVANLS